jgi:single-strand DNA-binding protein
VNSQDTVSGGSAFASGARNGKRTHRAAERASGHAGQAGDADHPRRRGDQGHRPAISNGRKGSGDNREEEPTAIQWTLWGKLAENAGQYLGKGSHVNVTGRLRNNHYLDAKGNTVFGFAFTVEEIDYLDSRAESEARRARQEGQAPEPAAAAPADTKGNGRSRKATKTTPAADDDVPF